MWGIVIALLSGALMSVQGVFNTEVTKQTSLWVSSALDVYKRQPREQAEELRRTTFTVK